MQRPYRRVLWIVQGGLAGAGLAGLAFLMLGWLQNTVSNGGGYKNWEHDVYSRWAIGTLLEEGLLVVAPVAAVLGALMAALMFRSQHLEKANNPNELGATARRSLWRSSTASAVLLLALSVVCGLALAHYFFSPVRDISTESVH